MMEATRQLMMQRPHVDEPREVVVNMRANCGCGWIAAGGYVNDIRPTQLALTPEYLLRLAQDHATETGHTVDVLGTLRVEKGA